MFNSDNNQALVYIKYNDKLNIFILWVKQSCNSSVILSQSLVLSLKQPLVLCIV
jgi:hypothetical protein